MHRTRPLPELPWILAGVSLAAETLLRCAGLPCVRVDQQQAVSLNIQGVPGRISLFESTRPQSNAARAALARFGLSFIDISRFTDPSAARPMRTFAEPAVAKNFAQSRADLLQLQEAVERAGGVWLRVADYPYPYQGALLASDISTEELPAGFLSSYAFESAVQPLQAFENRYHAGLPVVLPAHAFDTRPTELGRRFPLMWEPTAEEFHRWWTLRGRLRVTVRREGGAYNVNVSGGSGPFRPMLELWRGRHFAALPIRPGQQRFHESGVPFVEARHRSPVGFTGFCWGTPPVATGSNLRDFAQQSA